MAGRLHSLFKRIRLSTILLLFFISISSSLIVAFSFISYNIFSSVTFSEISSSRLALLSENSGRVSNYTDYIEETALLFITNKLIIDYFNDSVESVIQARRDIAQMLGKGSYIKNDIKSIEIYTDYYGNEGRSNDDGIYPLSAIENEPWFERLQNTEGIWVPTHISPQTGSKQPVISYVHVISDKRGNRSGYIKVNVIEESFFRKIITTPIDSDGQYLLIDPLGKITAQFLYENHTYVAAQKTNEYEQVITPSLMNKITDPQNTKHGYELVNKGIRSYMVLYSKPASNYWRLIQIVPTDVLLQKTNSIKRYVLLLGTAGVAVTTVLIYLFVRMAMVPLRKLIAGMRQVNRGNFDVEVKDYYFHEYGLVIQDFNHMVSQIKMLIDRVNTENRAKRRAEISALLAQIKPHFLYNTLDMIYWRAMDLKADDVSYMVTQLSQLFRLGLSAGKSYITLRDEMEHADCYMRIQKIRLDYAIDYQEKVPSRLKGCLVPKVIVQPFIENAVIHGFSKKHKQQSVHIEVEALMQEQPFAALKIIIRDNGPGLPDGFDIFQAKGIGIRNVDERIKIFFGESFGVIIPEQPEAGTEIHILLPVIQNEAELNQWLGDDSNENGAAG